MNIKKG